MEWTSRQIRAFRRALRMSQRELAAALEVQERSIRRWETGQHRPRPESQRRLDAMWHDAPADFRRSVLPRSVPRSVPRDDRRRADHDVGAADASDHGSDRPRSGAATAGTGVSGLSTVAAGVEPDAAGRTRISMLATALFDAVHDGSDSEEEPMHRRALLKLAAALGVLEATPELLLRIVEHHATEPVDEDLVAAVTAVTDGLATQAMTAPPATLVESATAHFQRMAAHLRGSMLPTLRQRLLVNAAETATVLGWAYNGMTRYDVAVGWYRRACSLAIEAGDRTLEADVHGLLASVHSRVQRGELAASQLSLRHLDIALTLVPDSAVHSRRWLAGKLAEERAAAEDPRTFRSSLRSAELAAASAEDRPGREHGLFTDRALFRSWTPAYLDKYRGTGLMLLGRPAEAVRSMMSALAETVPDVRRGTLLVDLSAAAALSGDLDAADVHGRSALHAAAARPRTLDRLLVVRQRQAGRAGPAQRELDERIRVARRSADDGRDSDLHHIDPADEGHDTDAESSAAADATTRHAAEDTP